MSENKVVILDGREITVEQLQEKKNNLSSEERIVETSPNNYETVTRMRG